MDTNADITPTTILYPTPPEPNDSNGIPHRTNTINTTRRRSLLKESQLNQFIPTVEDVEYAKIARSPEDEDKLGRLDSNEKSPDASIEPVFLAVGLSEGADLPVSQPATVLPRSGHSSRSSSREGSAASSRRNSWIAPVGDELLAQSRKTNAILLEKTPVEVLSPSQTVDHVPIDTNYAQNMFASAEAAKHDRRLRRASCPGVASGEKSYSAPHTAQIPSTTIPLTTPKSRYITTPASTPRRLNSEEGADESFKANGDTRVGNDIHATAASNTSTFDISACPDPMVVRPPLVNLLLLGDETCGLGDALDAFAGADRMLGISCKSRTILADSQSFRMRCWHTPGSVGVARLHSLLRKTHAILLIFDITSTRSFHHVVRWAEALVSYVHDHTDPSAPIKPRPILIIGNRAQLNEKAMSAVHDDFGSGAQTTRANDTTAAGASAQPAVAVDRKFARRSSLPSVSSLGRATDHLLGFIQAESHVSSSGRAVTKAQLTELVRRIHDRYGAHGPVDSMELDANLWRDRYRAFRRTAQMVVQCGALGTSGSNSNGNSANNSRTVSPVQELQEPSPENEQRKL